MTNLSRTISYYGMCITAFLFIVLAGAANAGQVAFATGKITVNTGVVPHAFDVEIATSHAQQEQGLMYRKTLAHDHGMIFLLSPPQTVNMWMKNTYVSLDMLFVDAHNRIIHIEKHTVPESTNLISSSGDTAMVIEVNANICDEYGITVGDNVQYAPHS